jgi:hypothetical protein
MKIRTALAAAALTLIAGTSFASENCGGKAVEGQPIGQDAIKTMLEQNGYQVRKMDTEDGCVEMKGLDKAGKRVEVYVHPVSGEIVKVKSGS